MTRFFIHWLIIAVALAATAYLVPGVSVTSWLALAVASLVLGFVNAVVRPILVLLTFPITLVTLGLFYLVVNGMAFGLAAFVVPGFQVGGCASSIVGALMVSLFSWFIGLFMNDKDED